LQRRAIEIRTARTSRPLIFITRFKSYLGAASDP
jgi:hypothetical protein